MPVKFQFDKDEAGERRIIITKEGGFDPVKMVEVIDVVEKMFDEESEILSEAEEPETDGRGKPAGELPDGTKIRHDGQIDGRSLRGAAATTAETDATKQSFADRLKKTVPVAPSKGKAQEK